MSCPDNRSPPLPAPRHNGRADCKAVILLHDIRLLLIMVISTATVESSNLSKARVHNAAHQLYHTSRRSSSSFAYEGHGKLCNTGDWRNHHNAICYMSSLKLRPIHASCPGYEHTTCMSPGQTLYLA